MKRSRFFNFILNVTRSCNCACRYCYVDSDNAPQDSRIISLSTLDSLFKIISDDLESASLIWHGGEPLLAGVDYYRKVRDLQSKYILKHGMKIQNQMQTNAALITKDMLSLFTGDFNMSLGVSIDGPKEMHDANRILKGGEGSFDEVMKGYRMMREHGINPGVISVVSAVNVNSPDLMYGFVKSLGVQNWTLCTYHPKKGADSLKITDRQYYEFHIRIAELWLKDKKKMWIMPITSLYNFMGGRLMDTCSFGGDCFKYNLGIMSNGDITPCYGLPGKEFVLGNISKISSISEVLEGDAYKRMIEAQENAAENCRKECGDYYRFCGSGCRVNAFADSGRLDAKDPHCHGRLNLIHEIARLHHRLEDG